MAENLNQILLTCLEKYSLSFPAERERTGLFVDFLIHSEKLSEAQRRGHLTASAWIINHDRTRVLLTHHAKLDKWLQLGGHVDPGESLEEAALREAQEESGLVSLILIEKNVFDIDAHLIPARDKEEEHFHFDIRFLFQADSSEPLIVSSESKDLRWTTPEEAVSLNSSPSLTRMIEKTGRKDNNVFGEIIPGVDYTPRQGAYGLLMNGKGQLALVKLPSPATYFLPGGGIEAGEDHVQCLIREFEEETGLVIKVNKFLGTSIQYLLTKSLNRYFKIIGHMYYCESMGEKGEKIEADHELVWVEPNEALDIMSMANQRWAVEKILSLS